MFRRKLIQEEEIIQQDLIKMGKKKIYIYITYILKFVDSTKFMASSLSNLVNSLSEEIQKIKCTFGHDDGKSKSYKIKYNIVTVFLKL